MNKKINSTTYTMAFGHLFCDMNQGALPAILPFLIAKYHFSYTAIAGLILAANLISSIIQPLIGHYSDRRSANWMLPLGVLLGSGGLAAIGILSNYWSIFLAVMISGIGIAVFHPEAAKTVNKVSGRNKASNMSVFSFGGTLGFALGPVISTTSILMWGLQGVFILLVPAVIMTMFLFKPINKMKSEDTSFESFSKTIQRKDQWRSFSLLSIILCIRSIVFYGLNTFIPIYWVSVLLQSKSTGSSMLSIFFLCGAIGTLVGGRLADQFGYIPIIKTSFVILFPALFLLGTVNNTVMATIMLICVGMIIFLPYSPMVVLGQKYLPNRPGLASGFTLGLAVSVGGIAAPVLGKIADIYGVHQVMIVIACISIVSTIFSHTLSNETDKVKRIQA
ncbi:MFS transporter [Shimazuella sp. AN120528]|uniref:MFS transporter n=1 Tax=Shimazuella soli TaxID=1892854 RepID=UPI001F0FA242|nr:MFS transporter [Shimazuella soli]MCH5583683.1 MFS transporter [Shimazuella soli]